MCDWFDVQIENRFQAMATEPVERVIRVHAASLEKARRAGRCDVVAPAARESDAGQARIVINALRREIDRLLRGIDRIDPRSHRCQGAASAFENRGVDNRAYENDQTAIELLQLASAERPRRTYAVAALGAPLAALASMTSQNMYAAAPPQLHATHMDSLGALIDVLA